MMKIEIVRAVVGRGITLADKNAGEKELPGDRSGFISGCTEFAKDAGAANDKAASNVCQKIWDQVSEG
jgi:hypothetical protein